MPFERNPDPLRRKVELDPAAEDKLGGFIQDFKMYAEEIITRDKIANDNVKRIVRDSLDLLEPSAIIASIIDNRFGSYSNKNLKEQFGLWMQLNFVKDLKTLEHDACAEVKERPGEGTMLSFLTDELEVLPFTMWDKAGSKHD